MFVKTLAIVNNTVYNGVKPFDLTAMSKDLSISRLCDAYGGLLTEHRREVIRSYYDDDLSLAEIAENSGVSRQAALCSIRQAEKVLKDCESKVGYVKKIDSLKSALSEVYAALESGDADSAKTRLDAIIKDI